MKKSEICAEMSEACKIMNTKLINNIDMQVYRIYKLMNY